MAVHLSALPFQASGRALFEVCCAVLLLAACAPASAPSAASPAGPPAAATAQPATLTKVPIQLNWIVDTSVSPYLYGIEHGFFREQGVDLDIIPGRGSDLAMQQINENKVQFAIADLLTYLAFRARKETATTAVMTHIDVPTIGTVSTEPITRPQELSGKSWGTVTFSAGRFLLPLVLEANGLDPKQTRIELMDVAVLYPSLFEGKIDSAEAHTSGTLAPVMLGGEKAGKRIYYAPLSDWGLKGYAKIMIVRDDLIQSNPALVRGVTTAFMKSINEARTRASDDEIMSLILKAEPQINRAEAQLQWTQFKQAVRNPGPIDPEVIAANLAYMAEAQNLRTDLKPEQLFTNEFIPRS